LTWLNTDGYALFRIATVQEQTMV